MFGCNPEYRSAELPVLTQLGLSACDTASTDTRKHTAEPGQLRRELEIGYKVSEAGRTAGREQQLAVGHKISMGQLNDTFYY